MVRARTLLSGLRRLIRAEAGSAMPFIGVSFPVILGAGAIAVDLAHLSSIRGELQATADVSARAGAWQLPDVNAAEERALDYAGRNMAASEHGDVLREPDITFGEWDPDTRTFTQTNMAPDAVRVVTRRAQANGNSVSLIFASIFGESIGNVSTEAIGALLANNQACVLALAGSGTGISIGGSVSINATQCGFAANSPDPDASVVTDGSSADVQLLTLYSAGGVDDPHGVINTTESPVVGTGRPLPNPYEERDDEIADEIANASLSSTHNVNSKPSNSVELEPGQYPSGFSFKGDVHLNPGVYVMSGDVSIGSGANVTGDDVTIIMDDSDIDVSGGPNVDLTAPSNGPTSGIVLARQGARSSSDLAGNTDLIFDGAIYMPDTDLSFRGTSGDIGCLQLVTNTVEFSGTPNFEINCDPLNGEQIDITAVQLVS
jgi:Flp pilus assembly protein TadG